MEITYISELLIIVFSIISTVLMFQLSSFLNINYLTTGIAIIEINDFAKLSGYPEDKIKMIPLNRETVSFQVFGDTDNELIGEVIFDTESLKLIEAKNINIETKKLLEFRKLKFSSLIKVNPESIIISEDGNSFRQIEIDPQGNEKIIGSVTFNDKNETLEVSGTFKKYF